MTFVQGSILQLLMLALKMVIDIDPSLSHNIPNIPNNLANLNNEDAFQILVEGLETLAYKVSKTVPRFLLDEFIIYNKAMKIIGFKCNVKIINLQDMSPCYYSKIPLSPNETNLRNPFHPLAIPTYGEDNINAYPDKFKTLMFDRSRLKELYGICIIGDIAVVINFETA